MGKIIMLKRLVDIIIASIAFTILLPVFIYVAFKVKKNLGSPFSFTKNVQGKMASCLK